MQSKIKQLLKGTESVYREFQKKQKRSPSWTKIRKQHLLKNPECIVCGNKFAVQVHHIIPFNENPELELDLNNLISLCAFNLCHLEIGHGDNFRFYNPELLELINLYKTNKITKMQLSEYSYKARRPNDGPDI